MKKSDLKTGMLAKLRNGDLYMIINNLLINVDGSCILSSRCIEKFYDDALKNYNDEYDIMMVSEELLDINLCIKFWTEKTLNENLLWEREDPKPILTLDGVDYSKDTLRSIIKKATS